MRGVREVWARASLASAMSCSQEEPVALEKNLVFGREELVVDDNYDSDDDDDDDDGGDDGGGGGGGGGGGDGFGADDGRGGPRSG